MMESNLQVGGEIILLVKNDVSYHVGDLIYGVSPPPIIAAAFNMSGEKSQVRNCETRWQERLLLLQYRTRQSSESAQT